MERYGISQAMACITLILISTNRLKSAIMFGTEHKFNRNVLIEWPAYYHEEVWFRCRSQENIFTRMLLYIITMWFSSFYVIYCLLTCPRKINAIVCVEIDPHCTPPSHHNTEISLFADLIQCMMENRKDDDVILAWMMNMISIWLTLIHIGVQWIPFHHGP